jgi:hypothetical protein
MANPFEILFEVALHLNGDPVFQEIVFLCEKLRRQFPETLFGKFAVSGTAKVHLRIDHLMATISTFPIGLVFEKLYITPAIWTLGLKDIARFPVAGVLAWTFHGSFRLPGGTTLLIHP